MKRGCESLGWIADKRGVRLVLQAGVGKGLLDGTQLVSWPLLKGVKCSP
jgi:hypothetical protein